MSKIWFSSDDEIAHIASGVADRSLPKSAWTHAAHFAAALVLLRERGQAAASRDMPGLIRAYNEATGVPNTDTDGYHETITQASIRAAAAVLAGFPADSPLHEVLNALMAGPFGPSKWPLAYWSGEALFSREARHGWIEPDRQRLTF